jgi:hypothetical protein
LASSTTTDTEETNLGSTIPWLWWLHPLVLFSIISLGTIHWAISMSAEGYRLYDCPKYIDASWYPIALLAVCAFAVGDLIGKSVPPEAPTSWSSAATLLRRTFWICTALTIFAYAVWLLVGIKNGFRPGMLLYFFSGADDKLGTFELKERIFPTVPGITTLSQCGVAAVILGLLPPVWSAPRVKWAMVGLVGMGFLRGMLLSERLAFIELVMVMALVVLRIHVLSRSLSPRVLTGLRVAPVLGPLLLLLLFGSFEYFRSWSYYQHRFNNIAEFTVWRVSAYYTTGHNNGALIHREWDRWPLPFQSITAVWAFPLVKYSPFSYEKLTGIDPDEKFDALLRFKAVEEYNNDSGLLAPFNDAGPLGMLGFWIVFGALAGWTQRSYIQGRLAGLCFYPLFFLTILETPRFIYLTISRATPPVLVFLVLCYIWRSRAARAPAPPAEISS